MGKYFVSEKKHTIFFYGDDYDSSFEDYFQEKYPGYEVFIDYDKSHYHEEDDDDDDYDDDDLSLSPEDLDVD